MLSRRQLATATLSLAVCLTVPVLASACSKEERTPEEIIKEKLDQATAALTKAKIKDAAELLADNYKDVRGRDKQKMKAIAFLVTRQGSVSLKRTDEVITVEGDKATVSTKVWAMQTNADAKVVADLIPRGQAVEVMISLERQDDEWKVTAIDGDPLGGD